MIPKYLSIQGFKSFVKEQIIDFTKVPEGLILITGDNKIEPKLEGNGAGKSTIFESLTWLLFGKTSTNLKASNIVNWGSKKPCKVEFSFEENGIEYLVSRTQTPNLLTLNGKVITQEELEDVLKLNIRSFLYSIFISQFGNKFVDLLPNERMIVFTDIMEETLGRWSNYSDKSKMLRDKMSGLLADLDKKKSTVEGKLQSINIEHLEEEFNDWDSDRNKKISDYLDQATKKEQEKIVFLDKKLVLKSKLSLDTTDLDKEKDSLVIEREEADKQLASLLLEEKSILKDIHSINAVMGVKENEIKELSSLEAKARCSFCKQNINKDILLQEISFLRDAIFLSIKENDENKVELAKTQKKIKRIKEEIEEIDDDKKKLEEKISKEKEKKKSIETEILLLEKDINSVEKEIVGINNKVEILKTDSNPFEELLKRSKEEFKIAKDSIKKIDSDIEKSRMRFEALDFFVKGFKDIKLMLTEEALQEFEISINNNIHRLGLGEDWNIELKIMDETKSGTIKKGFTVLVNSPLNNSSVPFECWSGGEAQRLRLAISFGLSDFIKSRRGIDWNWLILDEPSQFLSEKGIIQMIEILKEKSIDDKMKIFLIDHRKLPIFGEFDSFINVVKDINGSSINIDGEL